MRQYTPTYQRGKDRRKEEKKKNLRIKRDNINIGEQFFAMPNMLATGGSWIYAQEKEKKKLNLFSLLFFSFFSFSISILLSHAGMPIHSSLTIHINRKLMIFFKKQINLN